MKSTVLSKHRFMVQALQNPPLCSSIIYNSMEGMKKERVYLNIGGAP
jgi:hypothetical protein